MTTGSNNFMLCDSLNLSDLRVLLVCWVGLVGSLAEVACKGLLMASVVVETGLDTEANRDFRSWVVMLMVKEGSRLNEVIKEVNNSSR